MANVNFTIRNMIVTTLMVVAGLWIWTKASKVTGAPGPGNII